MFYIIFCKKSTLALQEQGYAINSILMLSLLPRIRLERHLHKSSIMLFITIVFHCVFKAHGNNHRGTDLCSKYLPGETTKCAICTNPGEEMPAGRERPIE